VLLVMACVIALVICSSRASAALPTYVLTVLTLGVVALQAHVRQRRPDDVRLWQHGGQRPHGQLAQVLCHAGHDGDAGLWPPYAADRDMLRGGE
jgi:hypothetical protein